MKNPKSPIPNLKSQIANLRSDIVAIGSSLGGLRAMNMILRALPAGYPKSVIIVQHRGADTESRLVSILGERTYLPVQEAEDKQPLLAGQVYVAPTGYHLLVERGHLCLSTEPPVNYAQPSIDVLFESVAASYRERAVGVLLIGACADGAQGLLAIKSAGGLTIAQDPKTAESAVMPEAAIVIKVVDLILPLDKIGRFLAEMR